MGDRTSLSSQKGQALDPGLQCSASTPTASSLTYQPCHHLDFWTQKVLAAQGFFSQISRKGDALPLVGKHQGSSSPAPQDEGKRGALSGPGGGAGVLLKPVPGTAELAAGADGREAAGRARTQGARPQASGS